MIYWVDFASFNYDGGFYGLCFSLGSNKILSFSCDYKVVESDSRVGANNCYVNLERIYGFWSYIEIFFCFAFFGSLGFIGFGIVAYGFVA